MGDITVQLHFEGWSMDQGMPKDWLYKKRKSGNQYNGCQYINESGHYFKNKEAALKLLVEKNLVEEQRIIENFIPESVQSDNKLNNLKDLSYTKSDPTVPSGWCTKKCSMGKQVLVRVMSPEGIIFNGRRMALKFMIENQYPLDQIEEMRGTLKHDNWVSDSALPDKWLCKKKKSGGYCFINQNGILLENKSKVLASVGKNDDLSFLEKFTKSVGDVKNHCPKNIQKKMIRKKRNRKKSSFNSQRTIQRSSVKQEDKLLELCPKKEVKKEEWTEFEDECLSGWKFMISASGSKHFRAPSGEVLRNRPQIEIFLKTKNVGEQVISDMIKGISEIGHTWKIERRFQRTKT